MSTQTESVINTTDILITEIDKYLASPYGERVMIPLMLTSGDPERLLENLNANYASRFFGDLLYLFKSFSAGNRSKALEINKQIVVYDARAVLTHPLILRGDSVLMYVIDSRFEDYRSKFLDRTMAGTMATARMNGFAGIIHKHG